MNKKLIIIAGPTAIGKTSLSIQLAQKYNCPIISFDSRQFYKEMSIGTAKPSNDELAAAEHYFINSHSVKNIYTAGKFETEALAKLDEIFKSQDYCIAVGGSGLYINALCYGIDEIPTNPEIRDKLIVRWKTEGLESLVNEVKKVDLDFFSTADMKNPRRVVRALEVFYTSGQPYSNFRLNQSKKRNFDTLWIGLKMERNLLNERINSRVDKMIEEGLIDEVKSLVSLKEMKALNTVGYRELFDFFEGKYTKEEAIEQIKRNTRHFAKRQDVWFNKNTDIQWVKDDFLARSITYINAL